MLKNVLVPLDFSKLSEMALPYAVEVTEDDGRITLLVAIEPVENVPSFPPGEFLNRINTDSAKKEMFQRAETHMKRVISNLPRPKAEIEYVVEFGTAADVILDFAKNSNIDLIVMSTHGRTGFNRWWMGSVTHKVLSAAPCPVIVVPGTNHVNETVTVEQTSVAAGE